MKTFFHSDLQYTRAILFSILLSVPTHLDVRLIKSFATQPVIKTIIDNSINRVKAGR